MSNSFEQISLKNGFMKHNGGVMFRNISENEYEFKAVINENHLNAAGITHGGYLAALIDAGAGTAAHRSAQNAPCVTISLDFNSQNKNTSVFVFFKIRTCPIISSPIFEEPIYFRSKEMVTHGAF